VEITILRHGNENSRWYTSRHGLAYSKIAICWGLLSNFPLLYKEAKTSWLASIPLSITVLDGNSKLFDL